MGTGFFLLLLLGSAFGATHVNISIGHNSQPSPADVTYVDGKAPAELKAGPTEVEKVDYGYHSAKLRLSDDSGERQQQSFEEQSKQQQPQQQFYHASGSDVQQNVGRKSLKFLEAGDAYTNNRQQQQQQQQQQHYQRQLQLRYQQQQQKQEQRSHQKNEHEAQNQEFERYIQKFHTGPTVETVYESSSPASQRVQQQYRYDASTSPHHHVVQMNKRPAQVHKFERNVALPTVAPNQVSESNNRQTHQIVNHQPRVNNDQQGSSLIGNGPTSSFSSSSSRGITFDQSFGRNYDQQYVGNYDQSFRSNHDQSSLNGYDISLGSFGQYRPIVDEQQVNAQYADIYSNDDARSTLYSQAAQPGGSYASHPVYQQTPVAPPPAVLQKTIHVAQPALKAKKYEIRRPAIQKQFYDIEERIVIKPAGTVVLELDHPVAKIPRGETIVPIGGGGGVYHQTVAGAGGDGSFFSSEEGAAAIQPQYNPLPVYQPKPAPQNPIIGTSTIASHFTTTPISSPNSQPQIDDNSIVVDAKSHFADGQFSTASATTTERTVSTTFVSQNNTGYYGGAQGTQQISTQNITPYMVTVGEPDFHYPPYVQVNSNGSPSPATFSSSAHDNSAIHISAGSTDQGIAYADEAQGVHALSASDQQQQYNKQYDGEILTGELYNDNVNNEQKQTSSRLQEQPQQQQVQSTGQTLSEQHNIHISPAQHNIFIESSVAPQSQTERYVQQSGRYEEAARVQEIKPFLQQHSGPIIVYATAAAPVHRQHYSAAYIQDQPQTVHSSQFRNDAASVDKTKSVQYSAPYTQQRTSNNPAQQTVRFASSGSNIFSPDESQRQLSLAYMQQEAHKPVTTSRPFRQHLVYTQPKTEQHQQQPIHSQRQLTIESNTLARHNQYQVPSAAASLARQEVYSKPNYRQQSQQLNEQAEVRQQASDALPFNQSTKERYTSEEPHHQTNIHIQVPVDVPAHQPSTNKITISSTIAPIQQERSGDYKTSQHKASLANYESNQEEANGRGDQPSRFSARYESASVNDDNQPRQSVTKQQKFQKLVNADTNQPAVHKPDNLDAALRSDNDGHAVAGHVATPGSRVIAATPAPTDGSGSESFHSRRIVINHPFQTVREVVEHEPITNYHQVMVNGQATPALYRQQYQRQRINNALQPVQGGGPAVYHSSSSNQQSQAAISGVSLSYNGVASNNY